MSTFFFLATVLDFYVKFNFLKFNCHEPSSFYFFLIYNTEIHEDDMSERTLVYE